MKNNRQSKAQGKKFHKIVDYIVNKGSPSSKENSMSIADEAEASMAQEGKKNKQKRTDLSPKDFD
jgi:hypothetical protein